MELSYHVVFSTESEFKFRLFGGLSKKSVHNMLFFKFNLHTKNSFEFHFLLYNSQWNKFILLACTGNTPTLLDPIATGSI